MTSRDFRNFAVGLAALNHALAIVETRVYTLNEAAQIVGSSDDSLRRAIKTKHLKAGAIGNTLKITGKNLLAWIEAGGRTGSREKKSK